MANNRPTMRELADAAHSDRLDDMRVAIAEGRLTVRQMTPRERKEADAHRAAGADARAGRGRRATRS